MRFTSAIANGRDLYAFRVAVNDAANTLYYREAGGGQVVVVSEPFDKETDWTEVRRESRAGRARVRNHEKFVRSTLQFPSGCRRGTGPVRRIIARR